MTRAEHIRALLEEYARQRAANEAELQARVEAACAKAPEIARLREESAALALSAMRSILSQQTREEREALAENMKRRGQAINARIRALLRDAGLPEDQLDELPEKLVRQACEMAAKVCGLFYKSEEVKRR